jgi:hypothetical protein
VVLLDRLEFECLDDLSAKISGTSISTSCSNADPVVLPDCLEFESFDGLSAKISGTSVSAGSSDPNSMV